MTSLVVAIFAASVLGSFHCAGMCGAFVALACGGMETSRAKQLPLAVAYHVGRLVTYVSLGVAAGAVGHLVNLSGALAGLRSVATALAAANMLTFAVVALARTRGVSIPRPPLPARWVALMQAGYRAAMSRPPVARAAAIGLLTTLLPCGWLYAFAVTAAGTGRPLTAAMAMAVFWAGTLPALVAVGAGVRGLLGPAARHMPTMTALAVVVVAALMLIGRARLDPGVLAASLESKTRAEAVVVPDPHAEKACCQTRPVKQTP